MSTPDRRGQRFHKHRLLPHANLEVPLRNHRKFNKPAAALGLSLILGSVLLASCGGGSDSTAPVRPSNVWQNPYLSPDFGNNIHNDSYLSDTYTYAGPSVQGKATIAQVEVVTFRDPATGQLQIVVLGECASLAFDADLNIQSVCAGLEQPGATEVLRSVVTLDRNTLQVIAYRPFTKPIVASDTIDFGGAGYFYQDNRYRMVVAMPDGHVNVLRRVKSTAGGVDGYALDADYNITGTGGAVTVPNSSLYAVMPDKAGNIWFATAQAAVGYITPSGVIRWLDLNDPAFNPGTSGVETIANSHAVDEGDSADGASGVYIVSTHNVYRFGADPDGTPTLVWKAPYDRGTGVKSGQVSFGSGTSPTVFKMNGRRFVTIADNAQTMNVNVYRAEADLAPGEQRLFAQVKPFGTNPKVSDENSLIVAANADGTSVDIYAENNWGNEKVDSTLGSAVTEPGFARMNLRPDGTFVVASVNSTIAVPSIVSKVSLQSNILYTYNKAADGWYITGLDATDLTTVRFTYRVGAGLIRYNNFYSGLAIDPDGETIWLGTVFGLLKAQIN
jgi:hypothetical protein